MQRGFSHLSLVVETAGNCWSNNDERRLLCQRPNVLSAVLVTKKGDLDDITLKVELIPGQESNVDVIKNKLVDQLRVKTGLGYNLEFHEYGTLPRYDVKAKRFKD